MEKTPGPLTIANVPFGYAIASLISLYLFDVEAFLSLEKLGFLILLGSLIGSFFAMYKPVERHLLPYLVKKWFIDRTLYSTRSAEEIRIHGYDRDYEIWFYSYAKMALKANPLNRTRGKITSIIYMITIAGMFGLIISVVPPLQLSKLISPTIRILAGAILLVVCGLFYAPLGEEIKAMRLRLYFEAIYLASAEGIIEFGTNFDKLEDALSKNDWPSAEVWCQRTYLEGKFYPRWPSELEVQPWIFRVAFGLEEPEERGESKSDGLR